MKEIKEVGMWAALFLLGGMYLLALVGVLFGDHRVKEYYLEQTLSERELCVIGQRNFWMNLKVYCSEDAGTVVKLYQGLSGRVGGADSSRDSSGPHALTN